jgi:hypothetical protein
MILGIKNTIILYPTISNTWTLLHKNVFRFENSGNSSKSLKHVMPAIKGGNIKGIGVRFSRAVAQIILAKIIYLIYKDGKDNN